MVTVVCTGGEAPPISRCLSWLEPGHRIIAADGGLALLRCLQRRADLWIGDGDSLGNPGDWAEWYSEARLLDRDKDETDTEAAVRAAGGDVWLLGGGGGRMDHWWANLRMAAQYPGLRRWLTSHEEIWALGPGEELVLEAGTVSVFPLGRGPWRIESEGLRWPLGAVDFSSWHSLSNESSGGTVRVGAGRFLVLKPFPEEAS